MTRHPIAAAQPASPAAGPAATAAELDAHRAALSDPERGYVVLRGFLDPAGVERYRSECAAFLARGRVIHTRMNRDDLPDYVHPRTAPRPDGGPRRDPSRGPDTWRIYQFLHNAHSAQTQALFERVLSLRDAIEAPWRADPAWRAEVEAVHDYVQVTRYVDDCEGLPRHHDTAKDLPHPMLQPLMLLSRPGIDYQGGDLFVWTRSGRQLSMEHDAELAMGDLLFFDRSLDHQVQASRPVPGAVGRWAVVLGARDRRCGRWLDRLTYGDFWHTRVRPLHKKVRRRLGPGRRARSAD